MVFVNQETGMFALKNITATTSTVLTDLLPLSPIYAQTKRGLPVMPTDEGKFEGGTSFIRRFQKEGSLDLWYLMDRSQRIKIRNMALSLEVIAGLLFVKSIISHDLNETALASLVVLWKGADMGLARLFRGDFDRQRRTTGLGKLK